MPWEPLKVRGKAYKVMELFAHFSVIGSLVMIPEASFCRDYEGAGGPRSFYLCFSSVKCHVKAHPAAQFKILKILKGKARMRAMRPAKRERHKVRSKDCQLNLGLSMDSFKLNDA